MKLQKTSFFIIIVLILFSVFNTSSSIFKFEESKKAQVEKIAQENSFEKDTDKELYASAHHYHDILHLQHQLLSYQESFYYYKENSKLHRPPILS